MNKKCKNCGADFHYCSSCDLDVYMSSDYCSKICYITKADKKIFYLAKKIERLIEYFDEEMTDEFWEILERFNSDTNINILLLERALSVKYY